MLRRGKRDRREQNCYSPKSEGKTSSRGKESKTVAVNTSVYSESEDEPSCKEYEIGIGCGKDKANMNRLDRMQFL
jgi:hypothetical protein